MSERLELFSYDEIVVLKNAMIDCRIFNCDPKMYPGGQILEDTRKQLFEEIHEQSAINLGIR